MFAADTGVMAGLVLADHYHRAIQEAITMHDQEKAKWRIREFLVGVASG